MLAIVYQQVKSGMEIEVISQLSIFIAILIFVGFIMLVQGIKVHGRRHGWFR